MEHAMSPRLKSVISMLYHPASTNGRQVFALGRDDAERLPRLETVALISITSPERPIANVDGFGFLLRLQFEDVDFQKTELSRRAREKLSGAFTADQATRIRDFVEGLPVSVKSIVIHCEGGYSRSAAVCLGLHRLYGYHVEMERLTKANPSVVAVLMAKQKADSVKNR
jgi:predicted protein tyrosine phosphatase